ncbi:MAG: hypothetical protein ABI123_09515 [Ginsengibacter sp.]
MSSCQKELSNEEKEPSKGSWEFSALNNTYSGILDTAYINVNKMKILGRSGDLNHTFSITLTSPTGEFKPGMSYTASAQEAEMTYSQNSKDIFISNKLSGEFIVSISMIDEKFVSGIFSGNATDSTGVKQQISQGKFSCNYTSDLLLVMRNK